MAKTRSKQIKKIMVHIIYKDNEAIGWELLPTTDSEREIAAQIRDLQFFGMDETNIEYSGIKLIDREKDKSQDNLKAVRWIQKRHLR
jgi:hypothetical protein